jgi:pilus assembly protein Flp/PilA
MATHLQLLGVNPSLWLDQNKSSKGRWTRMKDKFLKLSVMCQILLDENGQDLIEYALVVAMIAFAATSTMGTLAQNINNAFSGISNKLNSAVG